MRDVNNKITYNFSNVKLVFLIPPIFLLSIFIIHFIFFGKTGDFNLDYINIQKELFFYLNDKLSEFPSLQFNLTQFGDVLISFSLLSIFIIYAPKLWEALVMSGILSLILSAASGYDTEKAKGDLDAYAGLPGCCKYDHAMEMSIK